MKKIGAIILAGGEGTRLNYGKPSPKPKVLYEVLGKPLIYFSVEKLIEIGVGEMVVVVGYKGDEIKKVLGTQVKYALQEKALGTGDAALVGLKVLSSRVENVLILYGADIYSKKTLVGAINAHLRGDSQVTFVTKLQEDPTGYGRIIRGKDQKIISIVEEKVATDDQKKIKEVNDGCYIFKRSWFENNIYSLSLSKVNEYFLTDLVEIAIKSKCKIVTYTIKDSTDWFGVDSPEDIKNAERILRSEK